MRYRRVAASVRVLATGIVWAGVLAGVPAIAQSPSRPSAASLPRTPDGHPDFQGIWDYRTATPLERPRDMADKTVFTDEEARAFEKRTADRRATVVAVHPNDWLDYGAKVLDDKRTSLIVDPPSGRIPTLTPAARARVTAASADVRETKADDPEERSIQERCLVFGAGPPLLPGPYNNNIQIVQTPSNVVIMNEMIHDARIVPVDGRPHLPGPIRRWLGDSRGRWEGDTLVIETTNFHEQISFRGSDTQLRVTERFRLTGVDTLMYEFTIDDPTAFASRWTARFTMVRTDEPMFEYACHEGNQGLLDIMRGARFVERAR